MVYRSDSEHGRGVSNFLNEFERLTGKKLEEINPDTKRGSEICEVYDIVEYPSIIATTEDGQLINLWRGLPLPMAEEVSSYVQ